MLNKRGTSWGGSSKLKGVVLPIMVIAVIIGIIIVLDVSLGDKFDVFPRGGISANFNLGFYGFDELSIFGNDADNALKPLNYIFGEVPQHLVNTVEKELSAAIIIIAIWVMFFLVFADILNMFGFFSGGVSWIIALLLAIIGANLKVISLISVYFLTVTAVFGSLSILFSILSIFVIFVLFHFGGQGVRRYFFLRKAQEEVMRSEAGATRAAAAIAALKQIEDAAAKAGKP